MLSTKEINTKIAGIRKSVAALRINIHEVLCNAAGHAYEHGDVTAFTRLFAAVSGTDRHAIARWAQDFGFAKLNKDGTFSLNKAARRKADFADGDAVVEYLLNEVDPWYAYAKSSNKVAADLDVEKQVQSLIKRIKKTREEGERNVVVPMGARKALAELDDLIGSIREDRANYADGDSRMEDHDFTPRDIAAE